MSDFDENATPSGDEISCMAAIKTAADTLNAEQLQRVSVWAIEYIRTSAKERLADAARQLEELAARATASAEEARR